MTFFGAYRGPAWETGGHGAHGAHGARRRRTAHAPRRRTAHARRTTRTTAAATGTAPWHGPHESPTPMTFPLMALAVGAVVAGFVGIPAALGGGNAIEHFLEPSFTASHAGACCRPRRTPSRAAAAAAGRRPSMRPRAEHAAEHPSRGVETRPDGLLGADRRSSASALAWKFYVTQPGDLRAPGRSGSPARTACCRTSTTSTSCTTRRSSPARWRAAAGCGVRSQRRRRRGERHRLADDRSARGSRA